MPKSASLMASARIVIPCYNEEKRFQLASFIDFKSLPHSIDFLFVDDGSTDRTLWLLQDLNAVDPAKFNILHLLKNCGKAEAVRQGVLAAIASYPNYVGYWDADLATPLDAIGEFIGIGEGQPELELIMGSRVKLLGRTIERQPLRHYLGRIFATAVSGMLDLAVYDTQCGAKLFRASSATKELFERPFHSRWIFDVEIIARMIRARRGRDLKQAENIIYEFPLRRWKDVKGSKIRSSDFLRAAFELLWIRNYYFRKPQH